MVGVPARFRFSELPLWRKVSIGLAVGLFFFVGARLFEKEAEIYTSAPATSQVATRQVYPVHVNHGYTRYVTPETADNLASWRAVSPSVVAGSLLVIGLLLVTYRGDRARNG
jgi:hypothetical protein